MTSSPADVARRAAVMVQARGLAKGSLISDSGAVCLWGALSLAVTDHKSACSLPHGTTPEITALVRPIGKALAAREDKGRPWDSFPGSAFNDDPATTVTDVAKLLLQVADDIEFGGAS